MSGIHRGLAAFGTLWFSNCTVRVDTPKEYQEQLKSGRKFPNIDLTKAPNLPAPSFSAVEKLTINGIPFERIYWTVKIPGNREVKGVEYRSMGKSDDDVITIGANQGFGLTTELAQAEYMIMSLKRKS